MRYGCNVTLEARRLPCRNATARRIITMRSRSRREDIAQLAALLICALINWIVAATKQYVVLSNPRAGTRTNVHHRSAKHRL